MPETMSTWYMIAAQASATRGSPECRPGGILLLLLVDNVNVDVVFKQTSNRSCNYIINYSTTSKSVPILGPKSIDTIGIVYYGSTVPGLQRAQQFLDESLLEKIRTPSTLVLMLFPLLLWPL